MTPRMHRLFSFVALFMTLGLAGLPAEAQQPQYPYAVDTKPSRGIMPNSEQLSGPLDNIDPVTGKLHIQIPLASLPAGNAGYATRTVVSPASESTWTLVAGVLPKRTSVAPDNPRPRMRTVPGRPAIATRGATTSP